MNENAETTPTPDMYGQVHPVETPELIQTKLVEFQEEVDKIPVGKKKALQEAETKCPQLLDDDFKVMFLRCEVFHADLAALRYVSYWEKRYKIFGKERAFLSLTQQKDHGAFSVQDTEAQAALKIGYARIVQDSYDPSGRGIVIVDPSRLPDKKKYNKKQLACVLWYTLHSLLQPQQQSQSSQGTQSSVQQKGVVFIIFTKNVQLSHFDRELGKLNTDSIKGCLPVRVSAFHICHPPTFFKIVFPIMRMFLGERLRKRILIHAGTEEQVLEKLSIYGLHQDVLPTELGGNILVDHEAFLR